MSELTISISDGPKPYIKIIALSGEMDEEGIGPLRENVDNICKDENIKKIILDLRNLEFINSKGIGCIVSAHIHVSKSQKELILAGAKEAVMDVMSLVGLTTIIRYFESAEEAFAAI